MNRVLLSMTITAFLATAFLSAQEDVLVKKKSADDGAVKKKVVVDDDGDDLFTKPRKKREPAKTDPDEPAPKANKDAPKKEPAKDAKKDEDAKDEPPSEPALTPEQVRELTKRIQDNMNNSGERLAKSDPGKDTRELQKKIIEDLDKLIKQNDDCNT